MPTPMNKDIASDLGIRPASVKRHMEKISAKLDLRNCVKATIDGFILKWWPARVELRQCFSKIAGRRR
jgi:DNA-binding NarL/FixJ family response regulator